MWEPAPHSRRRSAARPRLRFQVLSPQRKEPTTLSPEAEITEPKGKPMSSTTEYADVLIDSGRSETGSWGTDGRHHG